MKALQHHLLLRMRNAEAFTPPRRNRPVPNTPISSRLGTGKMRRSRRTAREEQPPKHIQLAEVQDNCYARIVQGSRIPMRLPRKCQRIIYTRSSDASCFPPSSE